MLCSVAAGLPPALLLPVALCLEGLALRPLLIRPPKLLCQARLAGNCCIQLPHGHLIVSSQP